MGETSSNNHSDLFIDLVDDMYFSALYDEEEVFPISDEKYADELQLQEVLISGTIAQTFCKICMEVAPSSNMFQNNNCAHVFCRACLSQHIAAKLQENITVIKCPEVHCKGVLEPEICQDIVPKDVFERWETALCESMDIGACKFYCPFSDCSAMMLDDADEMVVQAECPVCRRLFCAQCKVAWHAGISCQKFQSLDVNERGKDDLILLELAKRNRWMRCPKCNFFVEKVEGCLHITCRCKFQFCYRCGQKWSSSHDCCSSS
ncbi:E3 ubiquitin-protein ligase RNF144 protein [Dioscorea alata]|uniref:E3 ubiquitin-protein ligase RNF144 protein n=1 Tax=Dioscorea alata TaxID=55571 RepID=A0ACB7VZB9_DIOAL|nr:E3 ubiquitin-protein ligase RNF144 protein [Dioscorea alata]